MASKKRRPGPGEENRHRRQKLVSSFANAWQGIVACFVEERNIKIHFLVAVLVMIFGFILQISVTEWCLCFVLFGLIMGLELVNTAVESVVDLVTEEWMPLARRAKDCAAGAVLIAAIRAAVVGGITFFPKLSDLFPKLFS